MLLHFYADIFDQNQTIKETDEDPSLEPGLCSFLWLI